MLHPWHDIALPLEEHFDTFPVVIEIPQGTKNKYELDKDTGFLRLDRVLYSAMRYPANYGFVPRTLAQDGDALDVMVLGQEAVVPLAFLSARAIGGFRMCDEHSIDDKIICVHVNDPAFADYHNVSELPRHIVVEMQRFFEDYKQLESKETEVGAMVSKAEALKIVHAAADRYCAKFSQALV